MNDKRRTRGPSKSSLDKWLDQFSDFGIEDQAGALKFAEVIHRQLKRLLREDREDATEEQEMFSEGGA